MKQPRQLRPGLIVLAIAATAGLGAPAPAAAQQCPLAPGCTQTHHETAPFQTAEQSLWGPDGDEVPGSTSLWLFDDRWNDSDSKRSVRSISTIFGTRSFGGEVAGTAAGRVAMKAILSGYGSGTFGVDYPVHVAVTFPEPNTFRRGDPVTITTAWAPGELDLHVDPAPMDFRLQGIFSMHNSAHYELCFFSCSDDVPFFPTMDIPETEFTFFVVEDGMWGIGDGPMFPPAGDVGNAILAFFTGITGTVNSPAPFGNVTVDGTRLSAGGSDEFVVRDVDHDKYLQFRRVIPGFPFPPLGADVPLSEHTKFHLRYETIDISYQEAIDDRESIAFDVGGVSVRADFPVPLAYEVSDGAGAVVASGSAASVTFPVGHSLTVVFPDDVEPLDLAPTFSMVQPEVERTSELGFRWSLTNEDLALSFDMDKHEFSFDRDEDQGSNECVSWDPTGLLCWLKEWVEDIVNVVYNYAAKNVEIDLGPVYRNELVNQQTTMEVLDDSWVVGGFETHTGDSWTLDPENPIIAVASSLANTGLATGTDYGIVTQTLVVENQGDVPLNAASIIDAVTPTGLAAALIESVEITVDNAFDGMGSPETLAGGQTLPVGGSATVTIRWTAAPGLHTASVLAGGTSPIGTLVEDDARSAFGWLAMHVGDPDGLHTINRRSRGVTPVHLLGSAGLGVDALDRASLAVEGVTPRRINAEDVNGDGIGDLTLLVPTPDLVAALDARMAGYETVVLAASTAAGDEGAATVGALPADRVAAILFGDATASDMERAAMDAAGNANGRLDVGDLRAAVFARADNGAGGTDATVAADRGGNGRGNGPPPTAGPSDDGDDDDDAPDGDLWTLVLTGTLDDGTTLWAEDAARIIGEAR